MNTIELPASFPSIDALVAAYRAEGGVISSVSATEVTEVVVTDPMVNCAGTTPTFFSDWTYCSADQLPNLYKGALDMNEVVAVQAPSQANGYTRLDVIQRELQDYEFVGAHAAEWYMKPENKAAFLEVCPSGYLAFVEKYRYAVRRLRVVYLYVHDGQVCVGHYYAFADRKFGAQVRFAVRRKLGV